VLLMYFPKRVSVKRAPAKPAKASEPVAPAAR